MQPSAQQSGGPSPNPVQPQSGLAEAFHRGLVRLDGLRDRPGFSTAVAALFGVGIALLWGLGQWNQPEPADVAIPSIVERASELSDPASVQPAQPQVVSGEGGAASGPGLDVAQAAWADAAAASTTSSLPELLVVHVSGAVHREGLVELPDGARLANAIAAAGGQTELADIHRLNLATPLVDGMHIRVPAVGAADEESELPLIELPSAGADSAAGSGGVAGPVSQHININQADAVELAQLSGVGPAIAAAIISWRTDHGPFQRVDDLLAVPGIGPAKLAAMQDQVAL